MPNSFYTYCRTLTDSQLEHVLKKEWDASRHNESREADYDGAEREAERRGWSVARGERVG